MLPDSRVRAGRHLAGLIVCSVLLLSPTGCNFGAADGHTGPRGHVRGTVTFGGKPVPAGSQVLFMGTSGGYTASGVVGADGSYRLDYAVAAGLPVGEYVVQVAPSADTGPAAPSEDPSTMAQRMTLSAQGTAGTATSPFPERYASTGSSGLKFTVEPGDNTADFVLVP